MDITTGILLGLSTGAVCLASCGPVIIPFLLGEANKINQNFIYVGLFLSGRLVSYILVGALAGLIGSALLQPLKSKSIIMGAVYCILGLLLILYGFYKFREICLGMSQNKISKLLNKKWPMLVPLTGGIITGLNICPPFVLAISEAMNSGTAKGGMLFFLMFFLGTSAYFVPLPFIGVFRRKQVLQIIGKFASLLAGIFYLYKGIITFLIV